MSITMHAIAIGSFVPMLRSLSGLLDKGSEHARAKKFDASVLAQGRLAPDMFPLGRHVPIACTIAEEATARLTGEPEPPKSDGDATIEAMKSRIDATIARLEKVPASAFEGAEDRQIEIPISDETAFRMSGLEYLRDWALPQFYFHVVTTYAILRHDGVELGIADYDAHVGRYLTQRHA